MHFHGLLLAKIVFIYVFSVCKILSPKKLGRVNFLTNSKSARRLSDEMLKKCLFWSGGNKLHIEMRMRPREKKKCG